MAAATVMAFSQIQAGRQAQRVANYNAQLYEMDAVNAENEAIVVQQKAQLEKTRLRDQFEGVQGDVRVGFAGGGVDLGSGTVLEILEQNQEQFEIDELLKKIYQNLKKISLLILLFLKLIYKIKLAVHDFKVQPLYNVASMLNMDQGLEQLLPCLVLLQLLE